MRTAILALLLASQTAFAQARPENPHPEPAPSDAACGAAIGQVLEMANVGRWLGPYVEGGWGFVGQGAGFDVGLGILHHRLFGLELGLSARTNGFERFGVTGRFVPLRVGLSSAWRETAVPNVALFLALRAGAAGSTGDVVAPIGGVDVELLFWQRWMVVVRSSFTVERDFSSADVTRRMFSPTVILGVGLGSASAYGD